MEQLVDQGLVKSIGVCNFSTQLLRHVLSTCRVRPSTLQIETHPHNTQEKLIRFAHEAGIRVTAYSVLGASSYLELNMATNVDLLTEDPVVVQIAKAKDKSPAQVLLRWTIQRNTLALSKTSTPARLIENRNIFDFYLTAQEVELISGLNLNRRYNDPGVFCEAAFGTFFPIYE
jgi:D-xylose reductase